MAQEPESEVSKACAAAASAFPPLGRLDPGVRAAMLDGIAAGLQAQSEAILTTCAEEAALTIEELTPEFARMAETLRMFADLVREGSWVRAAIDTPWHGQPVRDCAAHNDAAGVPPRTMGRTPMPRSPLPRSPIPRSPMPRTLIGPNHDARSMLVPLGPVAVFGSSNFPLAYGVCGGDTASALAAGCPVIIKEHPAHPRTGRLLAKIAREAIQNPRGHAGADGTDIAGVLHYVPNEDRKDFSVAQRLVQHPSIAAVGFTGSIPGGLAIETLARERDTPIPVFAEMGSNNIVVILPGAMGRDPHGLAMALADSVLVRCGQQCTKPGAILHVPGPGSAAFRSHLADRFRTSPDRPLLAPWIAEAYRRGVLRAGELGACPVAFDNHAPSPAKNAPHDAPTLMAAASADWFGRLELRTEIFGPTTILVELSDASEFARIPAQGTLAMSVWCDPEDGADLDLARALLSRRPGAGRIIFNGPPTGVRVATAMVHGGPFPATNVPHTTAVGARAIERWCRPLCWQNCPQELLPPELRDDNPRGIGRTVNGVFSAGRAATYNAA